VDKRIGKLVEAFDTHCRLATSPVAIRLAEKGDTAPQKARYPRQHVGHRLAVCQGMTLARTMGWTLVFGKEDHACPFPRIFMGHVPADRFLDGAVADYYLDDAERMRAMEASYPRWPADCYHEIWLAPLKACDFQPDLVVAYGNPAQILAMIHGANYAVGTGVKSVSSGRFGCSTWIAGIPQSDQCTYAVPGPGERVFAGTQDHEMSFGVPSSKFETFTAGLDYVSSRGMYRYPVPKMGSLAEPRIPEKYFTIDPDRQ
jgi:uncharacterized protein (DUF169 family)